MLETTDMNKLDDYYSKYKSYVRYFSKKGNG